MDLKAWESIAAIAGTVVSVMTLVNTGGWFILRATFVTKEDLARTVARLESDLNDVKEDRECWRKEHLRLHRNMDQMLTRVGERLESMPQAAAMTDVKVSIAQLQGEIAQLSTAIERVWTPLQMLLQHQLEEEA